MKKSGRYYLTSNVNILDKQSAHSPYFAYWAASKIYFSSARTLCIKPPDTYLISFLRKARRIEQGYIAFCARGPRVFSPNGARGAPSPVCLPRRSYFASSGNNNVRLR